MLIRSDGIHDVGPGIETITTAAKPARDTAEAGTVPIRSGPSVVQTESVEQHRQLYPSLTLRHLEMQGLSPDPGQLVQLGDRPWIATLLELASEIAEALPPDNTADADNLSSHLLEDINNVELLAAYRRVMVSG
jgi:hypothetical protein